MNWKGMQQAQNTRQKNGFYRQSPQEVSSSRTEVFHTGYLQQVHIAHLRKLKKSFHSFFKVLSCKHDFKSNRNDVTFLWRSQLVMHDKKVHKTMDEGTDKEQLHIQSRLHTKIFNRQVIFQIIITLNDLSVSAPHKAKSLNIPPWIPLRHAVFIP